MTYYPESHGYYYFKPYNYQLLPLHQQFVSSFGGDIRNPYDTSVLDDLPVARTDDADATMPSVPPRSDDNPFNENSSERYEDVGPGQSLEFVP